LDSGTSSVKEVCPGEHEQRVPYADAGRVSRLRALRRVQEEDLADLGRDAVARGPQPRREDLRAPAR
jgi:hypothetical protein